MAEPAVQHAWARYAAARDPAKGTAMTLDRRVIIPLGRARRAIFTAHRADLNFTGCGIGFRRRAGRLTDEPVVIAMVVRKRPEASISRLRLLPRTVDVDGRAWGVDVVEAGPFTDSSLASVPLVAPSAVQ